MAGGGPVTWLLATRATATALLAGHCVAAVTVEGGGGEGWGGSLTYLFPWPQGHSWRVEVEVTGRETVRDVPGVVLKVAVAVIESHIQRKAEKPNKFPGAKDTRSFRSEMSADPSAYIGKRLSKINKLC